MNIVIDEVSYSAVPGMDTMLKYSNDSYDSGVTPVNDRAVIYPIPVKDTYGDSEIIKPESSKRDESLRQIKARIVLLGPLCNFAPDTVHEGDLVLVSKYAGYLFKGKDGNEYRLVNDDDIAAVVQSDFDLVR